MEFRRRSARLRAGADRISALPDDLLLLLLARLRCARAAARTGLISRRWRGLAARLREIVFRCVALHRLEAALGRLSPAVSLLEIRVPKERRADTARGNSLLRVGTARANSLLRAAARLEPEELVFDLPSDLVTGSLVVDLPCLPRATSIALRIFLSSSACPTAPSSRRWRRCPCPAASRTPTSTPCSATARACARSGSAASCLTKAT